MNRLRQVVSMLLMTLATIFVVGFLSAKQPVAAATYPNQTLVGDLQLPEAVVKVMVANSLDANGQTPNVAANAVTVADIQQWQTVSLAERTQNADGSYSSQTSDTVAKWVGSLKTTNTDTVETGDMLLAQDMGDGSYPAAGLLDGSKTVQVAYNRKQTYTIANLPVYNVLMAVLMSATNAKTIDLTGLVSQVATASTRVKMLALFQTKVMTNLKELDLGYNLFGPGLSGSTWAYWTFRSQTLNSSSVTTWDLSYEQLTSLDSDLLSMIGNQTRDVNLASNVLETIAYNNGGYLDTGGNIDLGNNSDIDPNDSTTLYVLTTIVSTGGNTTLPDAVANDVVAKSLGSYPRISSQGIDALAPQLTTNTLKAIASSTDAKTFLADVDPSKLLASSVQGLSDADYQKLYDHLDTDDQSVLASKRTGGSNTGGGTTDQTGRLAASGNWLFANYTIGQSDPVKGTGATPVHVSGSLPPNQQLTVSMSTWSNGNDAISPSLSLPAGDNGWQAVNLDVGSPEVVLTNPNHSMLTFEQTLQSPLLTVPDEQLVGLQADSSYTGALT
ncbi:hypothetical protein [Lacticaseibacillus sp. GG6-2]